MKDIIAMNLSEQICLAHEDAYWKYLKEQYQYRNGNDKYYKKTERYFMDELYQAEQHKPTNESLNFFLVRLHDYVPTMKPLS